MRRVLLFTAAVVALAGSARAEEGIPRETLAALKAATVFVKVDTPRGGETGSGFLMKVDGDTGYVVTNHHVITPPAALHVQAATVSLVFNSGHKEEKTYPAEVLASDPDRDLAVLKVVAKDLPAPLDLAQKVDLVETMPVYMFGFPFGESLSITKGNPAITVGKGTVSSIRENERGETGVIQIDGDLNPGNSGGPVVDEHGRLVGVAVAKIRGTGIGMAIPPAELTKMLNGRIAGLVCNTVKTTDGVAEVHVEMRFIDPLCKIQSAAVRYRRAGDGPPLQTDKSGAWPTLPNSEKVELKRDGQKATATLTLKASDKDKGAVVFQFQPVYVNGAGDTVLAQPASHSVDFSKLIATAPAPDGKVPQPADGKESVLGATRTVADLTVMELKLEGSKAPRCLCWSADGKAFFHLHADGVLTRVSLADMSEQKRLDVGRGCGWLSLSAEGLVLTVLDLQEAWVIDPDTFKVKSKIATPSPKRIVSAPALTTAYSVTGDGIQVLDLKAGKVVKEYAPMDLDGHAAGSLASVTPDGKYLFLVGGIEQLDRFAVDGQELKFQQESQRIVQGRVEGVDVSPDGSHVCIPCGGGNYGAKGLPDSGPYSTYIFPAANLAKPDAVLRQGPYPEAVGFDPKAGLIYGQNFEKSLIVFRDTGAKQKDYDIGVHDVRQILAHPDGRKLLVLGDKLCFVELPKP
jgi:S1-C subfamily serine protease